MRFLLKPMGIPGVTPKCVNIWTPAEDQILIQNYTTCQLTDIVKLLPERTINGVNQRLRYLRERGLVGRKNKPLTPEELLFIEENAHKLTIKQISKHLERATGTIIKAAYTRGISFIKLGDANPATKYCDEDVRLLRALRNDKKGGQLTFKEISEKFEIPLSTVGKLYRYRHTQEDMVWRGLLP